MRKFKLCLHVRRTLLYFLLLFKQYLVSSVCRQVNLTDFTTNCTKVDLTYQITRLFLFVCLCAL